MTRRNLRSLFLVLGLALAGSLASMAPAAASWWNGDWQYRVKIDADAGPKGANVGEPIGRTQILLRLHSGNFKFDSAKPDGGDIRFVAADDRTPLHYHIEKWDGLVDQVALIWVDIPDLAPGAATPFFMYWGNDKANDASDPKGTYDPDQLLVWHFAEENGLPHDSTGYGNNALTPGKRDEGGIIGFGLKFDGSTQIKLPPNPTLNIAASQPYTWQLWVRPGSATESATLFDQRDAGGTAGFTVGLAAGAPFVEVAAPAGTQRATAPAPLVADAWHLISIVASDKVTLFVDGVKSAEFAGALPAINGAAVLAGAAAVPAPVAPAATAPAAPTTTAAPAPAAPAAATPAPAATPPGANYQGQLDELEISKAVRPAGALMIADRSQGPQADLLTLEAPEQTSAFGSGYIGIIIRSVTPDAWVVIGILIVMSIVSWLVMVSKAISISRTGGANARFRKALRTLNRESHGQMLPTMSKDRARGLRNSCLFRIYETGERELNERLAGGRTLPDGSIAPQSLAAIRSAMDATMVMEGQKLSRLMVLLTISIAGGPFIGLLGTVVGVMITFAAIAAAGDVNVNSIAPGISAALLATVAGLFVAIPALFGYNIFQTRIKSVSTEMAVFVDEVVTRIAEGNLGSHQQAAE